MSDGAVSTRELGERGVDALRDLFEPEWTVVPNDDAGFDVVVDLISADGAERVRLAVDIKRSVTPREVEGVLKREATLVRRASPEMLLFVVAPWIAPRTQAMLRESGIGYLDLTGNISLRTAKPPIMVHTQGMSRPPRGSAPRNEPRFALAGSKAGRLVRALVDFAPPYRAGQVAEVAGLSLPWVSKLLARLEDQLLIKRDGRVITDVDWRNLLRARAETFSLLKHNKYVGALAPNGVAQVLTQFDSQEQIVVTGSYAARRVAPLAVGGQLMLYVEEELDDVVDRLGLLGVAENPEVLLLAASDVVVFARPRVVDGINHVALSQLALDCLAGPGRMPAEGEAVIEYMGETEKAWRRSRLLPSL